MPLSSSCCYNKGLTTDLITNFPELTASKCTSSLVIINRFTLMLTFFHCTMDSDTPKETAMFLEIVIIKHEVPDYITANDGS
jgi:hypothetical protein